MYVGDLGLVCLKLFFNGYFSSFDTSCEFVFLEWECSLLSNWVPKSKVVLLQTFQATLIALGSMCKIPLLGLKFGRCIAYEIQDANVKKTTCI